MNESYLEIFRKNRELIDLLTYVFSQSEYLSKLLMTRPQSSRDDRLAEGPGENPRRTDQGNKDRCIRGPFSQ